MTVGRLLAGLAAVAAAIAPSLLGRPARQGVAAAPAARAPSLLDLVAGRGVAAAPAARAAPVVVVGGAAPARPSVPAQPPAPARPPPPPASPPPPGPDAVSRRFVVAYAAFVYGRLPVADLPDLSPALRRQVEALRPRPAAAVLAAADPRLRSLRVTAGRPGRARALAVIADGPADYAIAVDLRRRSSAWTIIGLAEAG